MITYHNIVSPRLLLIYKDRARGRRRLPLPLHRKCWRAVLVNVAQVPDADEYHLNLSGGRKESGRRHPLTAHRRHLDYCFRCNWISREEGPHALANFLDCFPVHIKLCHLLISRAADGLGPRNRLCEKFRCRIQTRNFFALIIEH